MGVSSIVRHSVVVGVILCGTIFAQMGGWAPAAPAPVQVYAQLDAPFEDGEQADEEPQQAAEEPWAPPPVREAVQAPPPVQEQPRAAEPTRETPESEWEKKAKNIVSVDFNPTVLAIGMGQAFSLLNYIIKKEYREFSEFKGSGFGIGIQYTRRLPNNLAAALRFDYLTTGPKFEFNGNIPDLNASRGDYQNFNFTTYFFEGHIRYYPLAKGFFVDGNLSFGNLIFNIDQKFTDNIFVFERNNNGNVVLRNQPIGVEEKFSPALSLIKIGPAFGLTESLGENGGITMEFSFGYQFGIPVSKSITDQLGDRFQFFVDSDGEATKELLDASEKFLFGGGPRLATTIGWSF